MAVAKDFRCIYKKKHCHTTMYSKKINLFDMGFRASPDGKPAKAKSGCRRARMTLPKGHSQKPKEPQSDGQTAPFARSGSPFGNSA